MVKKTDDKTPAKAQPPSARCSGICKGGAPCRGRALPDSTFCLIHDERYAEARQEWSRRGGHNRSRLVRAERRLSKGGQWLLEFMRAVIAETYDGSMPAARSTALVNAVGMYLKVFDTVVLASELEDIELKASRK